jgi:RNA polymerase sigma-70 factor, ECF subfamily
MNALVDVLDPRVTLTSDGGGVATAARRPVHGAAAVARFLIRAAGRLDPDDDARITTVNGVAGVTVATSDRLSSVICLTVERSRITRVDVVRAPAKLRDHAQ